MTNRTWIGGGNNQATNPADWSPKGAPRVGDFLAMTSGTMNITGVNLTSDSYLGLNATGSTEHVSLNLAHGASLRALAYAGTANFAISSTDKLVVSATYTAHDTVNIATNSAWVGNFNVPFNTASINVNGAKGSVFINTVTSPPTFTNGGLTYASGSGPSSGDGVEAINVRVAGNGIFDLDPSGTMTFTNAVGSGQTVDMIAPFDTGAQPAPILRLTDPTQFAGSVSLASGEVDLIGLIKADSYTYANDMLSIFFGGKQADTLKISSGYAFWVEKTAVGVSIYAADDPHPGTPLKLLHA